MDRRLRHRLDRVSRPPPPPERIVEAKDLEGLPEPAQRYLRFMGVVDKPRTWSFAARFSGRFRSGVSRPWAPARGVQYNTISPPTRIFLMGLRLGFVPVRGEDTYVDGQGRMRARVLSLKTVVDDTAPETTTGELSTYLCELVNYLPSAVFEHDVTWRERDDRSFDLTLRDRGRSVTGTTIVDERGACTEFTTTDRYLARTEKGLRGTYERVRWSAVGGNVREIRGRKVDLKALAVWHRAEGDLPYADFTLEDIEWNV